MLQKRGQTWSLETYLAIGIFLIAIIFFYSLSTIGNFRSNVTAEVEEIGEQLINSEQLGDGQLTNEELLYFVNLNCTALKQLFNTNQEICIYLKDSEGNLIENASHVIHGIGCPGVNISGRLCGEVQNK
jgi:uncharacterized protein (UPF0333 family)